MEDQENFNRIKFLIGYNSNKTLLENYISEDSELGCKCPDGKYSEKCCGSKSDWVGPNSQYVIQTQERGKKGNYSDPTTAQGWDHETSSYIELGLLVGGGLISLIPLGFTQVIGGVMISASLAVGVADAIVYFGEKDPYMGTMMLALQLIPGGELVTILKKSPKFLKYGDDVIKLLEKASPETLTKWIKSYKSGKQGLTEAQERLLLAFRDGVEEMAPTLLKKFTKNALIVFRAKLMGLSLSSILGFLMKLFKWTGSTVIKVLGVTITVDKFWTLYTTPESYRKKMRDKASFSKIMDSLYAGTLDDQLKEGLWAIYQKLFDKDGNVNEEGQKEIKEYLLKENMTDEELFAHAEEKGFDLEIKSDYSEYLKRLESKFGVSGTDLKKSEPMTLQGIIDGKYTLQKNQKNNLVKEIQKMLVALDYNLGTSGKNSDGVDGDFGQSTFDAVIDFQVDNDLIKFDGIVGSETIKKLKKLYDEKSKKISK